MSKAICDVIDKITNERCKNKAHREGIFVRAVKVGGRIFVESISMK